MYLVKTHPQRQPRIIDVVHLLPVRDRVRRSAEGFTQKTTWNGATSTTAGDGATIKTTTPGGRTVQTTTDNIGRPKTMQLPGLPAISIEYDQGRPTKISQGGRSVSLGYSGAFVSEITDPLGRTVNIPRVSDGRVDNQDVYGIEQFDYGYDDNGNLTGTTSPQSGGYSESTTYSLVDLVESFNLPAGQTTVSYNLDREPTDGTSPQGALDFDGDGRLTDIGPIHYTYDDDDYVTQISSPDGTIDYGYEGKPVPTSITWAGSVNGTVEIGRNGRFQATSIGVAGGPSVDITVDPDGVVSQVGDLGIDRNAATAITATSLGGFTDRYQRNEFAEPAFYEAKYGGDTLFSEEYNRDKGGRIKSKTVRILDPVTGEVETFEVTYDYNAPGQLTAVQYNEQPVSHYEYDGNTNLTGEPADPPAGGIFTGPRRLYLNESAPAQTPPSQQGTWTSTTGAEAAQMSPTRKGAVAETTVTTASCSDGDQILINTFVSTPITQPRTFAADEQIRLVVGAKQTEQNDALQPVASVWVMDSGGNARCVIVADWQLGSSPLPTAISEGLGDHTGPGDCSGEELQVGDRIVFEIGYRCTETSATPVEGGFTRGGTGPALTAGGNPDDHACGQPGYVEIDGDWFFASDPPTPCEIDTQKVIPSRRLHNLTIGANNQAVAASLTTPQGATHDYTYSYDGTGALQVKTDVIDPLDPDPPATVYTYDGFGNLRHVELPDGRSIDYLIDASQRRVGRVLKDASNQVVDERRWLYQSGLRPVVELDANNEVRTFFVYANKPNVPEYARRGGQNYRIITDHLGSLRLVVNSSTGEIKQRMLHDEHGNVVEDYVASGWDRVPFGYAGGIYDRDTGLVRFGARDYDPEIGRWVQQDPIGFVGGQGNLYAYVVNDPIDSRDPNGLLFDGRVNAGERYGAEACQYYADWFNHGTWVGKAAGGVGGFFACLWTPETSDYTAATLAGALGVSAELRQHAKKRPYGRYEGEKSNPKSPWLTHGKDGGGLYGDEYEEAKDKLQLPYKPDRWREVDVPWYEPVRGPRPARQHPEWGEGGGPEYYRGWWWPE